MNNRRHRLILLLTILIVVISACNSERVKTPTPEGTYPIDPIFQKFYNQLGGKSVLGHAISPVFTEQGKIYQYVVAGLFMYDPADRSTRLAPIGRDLGIRENPQSQAVEQGGRYIDGYRIFDKFLPMFDRLGGESVVGKPLTEAHFNAERNRYEQYFENLGFYWLEGDKEDNVYLLAYGDWECKDRCPNIPDPNAVISWSTRIPAVFGNVIERNGLDFTGYILSSPYINQDGVVEQIYENLVMLADPKGMENAYLLNLPERVGKLREAPGAPSPVPGMRFFAIQENLGYNVPLAFDEYIQIHGGYNFIGQPITHVSRPDIKTIEQCFTNLCLQGELNPSGAMEVRPLALGIKYRDIFKPLESSSGLGKNMEVTMQLWESYPLISPDQEQEIGVVVFSGGEPVPEVSAELTVRMPDGEEQMYRLPPTDQQGETRLRLDPLQAENGTLVPYRACIQLQSQQKFCVMDSYLIWQTGKEEIRTILPPGKTSYLPFVIKNFHMYVPAFVSRYLTYMPFIGNSP